MAAGIALAIGIAWRRIGTAIDSDPVERVIFLGAAFFATSFVGAVGFPAGR